MKAIPVNSHNPYIMLMYQPIHCYGDPKWSVTKATMYSAIYAATYYNQDYNRWPYKQHCTFMTTLAADPSQLP